MTDTGAIFVFIAIALVSEWKNYKSAASANRWFAAALYITSAIIWLWMASRHDLPRPGNWMDDIFR